MSVISPVETKGLEPSTPAVQGRWQGAAGLGIAPSAAETVRRLCPLTPVQHRCLPYVVARGGAREGPLTTGPMTMRAAPVGAVPPIVGCDRDTVDPNGSGVAAS